MVDLPQPPFPMPFPVPKNTDEAIAHALHFTEGIDETKPRGTAPFLAGFFADENGLLAAAKAARAAGHTNLQAWSPFPVHGLDPVLGLQRSLIGRPVFMTALAGFAFCFIGITWLMVGTGPSSTAASRISAGRCSWSRPSRPACCSPRWPTSSCASLPARCCRTRSPACRIRVPPTTCSASRSR